jgi:cyclic pyranopterin phosphate synthase
LYLCLFAGQGYDLRDIMRSGASDEMLTSAIGQIWTARADRYSELRGTALQRNAARVEMSYIGG